MQRAQENTGTSQNNVSHLAPVIELCPATLAQNSNTRREGEGGGAAFADAAKGRRAAGCRGIEQVKIKAC